MRLRNIPGSREYLEASPYVIQDPASLRGTWRTYFGNDHPIHIEIGTGKGRFIIEMAELHPDINYIGIEKYSSVLFKAVKKEEDKNLPNVRYIRWEAELLLDVFGRNEVDRIYLNFSDPWPKKSQAKRRLPCKEFLRLYSEFLTPDGTIEFKTDNADLFAFAEGEVDAGGYRIDAITHDLHHDPVMNEGNVMTEYEAKFSAKGNPICKYIISRKPRPES